VNPLLSQVVYNEMGCMLTGTPESWAIEAGNYRYALGRRLGFSMSSTYVTYVWVMLNPSTADARNDDHTIRKVLGFSERLKPPMRPVDVIVVNLFALRETHPSRLWLHDEDPIGKYNDRFVDAAVSMADTTILAWGAVPRRGVARARAVEARLLTKPFPSRFPSARTIVCLDRTKHGEPAHPLRLSYALPFRTFEKEIHA
jgi:hypothetical protein